jgi:beta-glucanase (GH16 family)
MIRAATLTRLASLCLAAHVSSARAEIGGELDLSSLVLSFEDRFADLHVTPQGPGGPWVSHTPWHGDFGDARFGDPGSDSPFSFAAGALQIEAKKEADGRWRAGLLASVDPDGRGFSQRYGYFEMHAKLPEGRGLWPAFWLSTYVPPGSPDPSVEVDVMEHYGAFPAAFQSVVTVWPKTAAEKARSERKIHSVPAGLLSTGFHDYGALIDPHWIVIYFDRREVWRAPTPPELTHKFMILFDLALGGGWPIDKTPSPSVMQVEYIRAYRIAGVPE